MILVDGYKPKFSNFPNNERMLNYNTLQFNTVSTVTFKYETDQDLIDLYILKSYMDTIIPSNCIRLKILYMPYSRMDRMNDFYTFNLKYICRFINSMNFYKVTVIDAHSDVTCALLDRCENESVISYLYKVRMADTSEEHVIVYPDATAEKRYSKYFTGIKSTTASKERDFVDGNISKYKIDTSIVKNMDVVLIDDLCSKGGTFITAANVLKEAGCKSIDLIVAHCEENIMNGDLLNSDSPVRNIYTTNSIITVDFIRSTYGSIWNKMLAKLNIKSIYEVRDRD